jgi:hypothetical protein
VQLQAVTAQLVTRTPQLILDRAGRVVQQLSQPREFACSPGAAQAAAGSRELEAVDHGKPRRLRHEGADDIIAKKDVSKQSHA